MEKEQNDMKIEDILNSIRGIIDNPNIEDVISENREDDSVLELTNIAFAENVAEDKEEESLLSKKVQAEVELKINKFTDHLEEFSGAIKEKSLDVTVSEIMRPLIKSWLDNNLPRVVEKVLTEEIKKIIPKK